MHVLSIKQITKVLVILHRCSGLSAPLLFEHNKVRFPGDKTQMIYLRVKQIFKMNEFSEIVFLKEVCR